jgi:hypothetical protein
MIPSVSSVYKDHLPAGEGNIRFYLGQWIVCYITNCGAGLLRMTTEAAKKHEGVEKSFTV